MICKKIKQLLSEAQLKGLNFIEIDRLTDFDIHDLQYCGFNVSFKNNKYKISM